MPKKWFHAIALAGAALLVPAWLGSAAADEGESQGRSSQETRSERQSPSEQQAQAQQPRPSGQPSTDDAFYGNYEGGFDTGFDEDDWFFDYYAYDANAPSFEYWANYDAQERSFDWEESGLFA